MKCDKVSHPDCLIFVAVTCELTCGAVWVTYGTILSGSIAQERGRQNKSMSICSCGAGPQELQLQLIKPHVAHFIMIMT